MTLGIGVILLMLNTIVRAEQPELTATLAYLATPVCGGVHPFADVFARKVLAIIATRSAQLVVSWLSRVRCFRIVE